ncbi:UNVERIFIED_CONTAM: GDSL esterase/lipase [Sesamum radiatum]|uniref:GDSL esterase/lipase n=1 Tax=Sesamum radiatum TaxID=300843 RepID=A0AAW2T0Y6_SESRA
MAVAYAITILILIASSSKSVFGCYKSIISFGDSLTDTGNFLLLSHPPTRPHVGVRLTAELSSAAQQEDSPTAVSSLISLYNFSVSIFSSAESLGLPLVEPYAAWKNAAEKRGSFSKGVNFAVAGATALDATFFDKRGIHNSYSNASLGVQLDWFKQFLARIPDSRKFLKSSLVLMGEIGGNDYNYPIVQGNIDRENIRSFVPTVVNYIRSIIEELIKLGVKTMLIPGDIQLGCIPMFLTQYMTFSKKEDYNPKTGCLTWLNELSTYHNELLQKELSRIRQLHPRIAIIYADYYNATTGFYLSPHKFGKF